MKSIAKNLLVSASSIILISTNVMASDTVLLKGKALTSENVVQALTPHHADAEDDEVVTRQLVIGGPAPAKPLARPTASKKAAPSSASLLITFLVGSAELTASAKKQLAVVAEALNNNKLSKLAFNIEGHADPRGNREQNLQLSQRRSESVKSYLVNHHGIDPTRLNAVGKGDGNLLNTNNIAAPENRRVSFVTIQP